MGKNIMINLIPSLFLPNKLHKQLWPWPSCNHPKTLSFRAPTISIDPAKEEEEGAIIPALMHRIPSDPNKEEEADLTTLDSCFTNSSESASISTESEKYFDGNDQCSSSVETIVRGVRSSKRLFFRPDRTSSILETQGSGGKCTDVVEIGGGGDGGGGGGLPYKESVVMEMESDNPYSDFKKSMKEMVESHGLKDWDCLMELLRWYLRMNGKNNHEFIVGAFVDLLSGISGGGDGGGGGSRGVSGSDHSMVSFTSVASTFSSPLSDEVDREKKIIKGENLVGRFQLHCRSTIRDNMDGMSNHNHTNNEKQYYAIMQTKKSDLCKNNVSISNQRSESIKMMSV